jgi:hypothetical protein
MRSSRVWMRYIRRWMRSSRVVRASDSQCRSRNCTGFDPSILRHIVIWGAADEAEFNKYRVKNPKIVPFNYFSNVRYVTLSSYKLLFSVFTQVNKKKARGYRRVAYWITVNSDLGSRPKFLSSRNWKNFPIAYGTWPTWRNWQTFLNLKY